MSGGSYNYLGACPPELAGREGDIRDMRDRLRGLGANPAAQLAYQRTELVLSMLITAKAVADGLQDVWHAIEWWDSGDWGEDGAMEALEKWRKEQK